MRIQEIIVEQAETLSKDQWVKQVRQQHPTAIFIQAKQPGSPIIAMVRGRRVAQWPQDTAQSSKIKERLHSSGQELAQASSRSRSRFRPSDPDQDDIAQDPVDTLNIDNPDMDSGLVGQELTAWLEQNQAMFKPGEWAVLNLHFTDGLGLADAAERLGISRADVRRLEKQAIGKLRRNKEFQKLFSSRLEGQEDQDFDEDNLNEWIPDRKYCQSRSADKLGASQAASCKSQGFIGRDSKVKARLGKSRERIGQRTVKGRKYGGPTPDWS